MKKKNIFLLAFLCTVFQANVSFGKEIVKRTYLYSVKGADSLYLDRYSALKTIPGERPETGPYIKPDGRLGLMPNTQPGAKQNERPDITQHVRQELIPDKRQNERPDKMPETKRGTAQEMKRKMQEGIIPETERVIAPKTQQSPIPEAKGGINRESERSRTAGLPAGPTEDLKKPCMIFVFGGGFVTGSRNEARYLPYFTYLAEKGYEVISIDYRLGLKPLAMKMREQARLGGADTGSGNGSGAVRREKGSGINPLKFAQMFVNTVDMAVEDLYDATNFILEHAHEWGIDKDRILISGSSAGAITVLQGEYYICNKNALAGKLPGGFNYAGVISFAGAVFQTGGKMRWENKPAPIQMFHGNADRNVPYGKAGNRLGGFYGSEYISRELRRINAPYFFYSADNAAHEIAVSPMIGNHGEIGIFLDKLVMKKEPLMIDMYVKQIGKPDLPKHFGIMDYIKANFR